MIDNKLSNTIIQTLKLPELHLVLGGIPDVTDANTFVPESDALVAKRIGALEKALIADNNEWQYGKVYTPWAPDVTSNYYVYNPSNRIVYLCTDNRPNNRIDEQPGLSTQIPSHTAPEIVIYEDGYSWIPLFMVDISQLEFLSKTDLPIPNLQSTKNYLNFSEKYQSLCGTGVTAFGCCCLYFKTNSVDELTGEVYSAGDVTNETIFSDCFECQKLADALDREVVFLSGYTAGAITSSQTSENPLCPATKQIKSLKQQLADQKYTLTPGSSKEYALFLLENFTNNKGILSARIDLGGISDALLTITKENPQIPLVDITGNGGSVQFNTTPTEQYGKYKITGVELLSSGSNYTQVTDWDLSGTTVDNLLKLVYFPDNFYSDPTSLIIPKRIRVRTTVDTEELDSVVSTSKITKFALLIDPAFYDNAAPAIYPEGDSNYRSLQTFAFGGTGPIINLL